MINYYCPGFYRGYKIYKTFLEIQDKYPEIFYPNVRIKKIFDIMPGMIWNGGGVTPPSQIKIEDVKNIIDYYKDLDITLQLTMTNPMLTQNDCYDRYCNMVLEELAKTKNEILITSPILEDYIRQNYPEIILNRSIIATEFDSASTDYEKMLNKYNMVVLPRRLVKDFDFLSTIPLDKRNRFELLCNDPCPIDCPRIYNHYKEYGKSTLFEAPSSELNIRCTCFEPGDLFRDIRYIKDQITVDEIYSKYQPLNFTEFKLSGRSSKAKIVTVLAQYFILPEYQILVIRYLLNKINF